jgi:hypothetical protein
MRSTPERRLPNLSPPSPITHKKIVDTAVSKLQVSKEVKLAAKKNKKKKMQTPVNQITVLSQSTLAKNDKVEDSDTTQTQTSSFADL